MPGMLGSDLAASVRTAAPGLPIVLCSGHLGDGAAAEAVQAVADRVLAKPVDEAALLAALAELAIEDRATAVSRPRAIEPAAE
jgi:CheY-like chemotaxis protein